MNEDWNTYITNVLLPRIHQELNLEITFKANLYKLLVYNTGSFFKPHRDSEKEDGMFATLVVQLPSKYSGGKLVVRHNNRTESIDFSTDTDCKNEFSAFYSVFYCDCEHEVLPITSGYRVCLIYNLVSTGEMVVPMAIRTVRGPVEKDLIDIFLTEWPKGQKLIYCLSHKYSQKNLSFEQLKTTDRILGQFLNDIADKYSLRVLLGILHKESYVQLPGDNDEEIGSYSSNNEEHVEGWEDHDFERTYSVENLKLLNGEVYESLSAVNVDDSLKELIPEQRLLELRPSRVSRYPTGNAGTECTKFYQCATFVIFHEEDLPLILCKDDREKNKRMEEMFHLDLVLYKDQITDENVKCRLLRWCIALVSVPLEDVPRFLKTMYSIDNVALLQEFIKVHPWSDNFPHYVIELCEKYGWSTFSENIILRFKNLSYDQKIKSLQVLIGQESENDEIRKSTLHRIINDILKQNEEFRLSEKYSLRYKSVNDKQLLLSLWPIATKIGFSLAEYVKSKEIEAVVPILIDIAEKWLSTNESLDIGWIDVAKHFMQQIENLLSGPSVTLNWKFNVKLDCSCSDCGHVDVFLKDENRTAYRFKAALNRRTHLEKILARVMNVSKITDRGSVPHTLCLTKTKRAGQDEQDKMKRLQEIASKLRAFLN